jgi:hypothetical protein
MVMTAFAACLFALAALGSGWTLLATARRYGPGAANLRAQLEACPSAITLEWKMVERMPMTALVMFRKRPVRRMPVRQGLEWPGVGIAA